MLEDFQEDSWGSILPLRMSSLLPHDLCHGPSASLWPPTVYEVARVRHDLVTKPLPPPPGWERQPTVRNLGMSLQGGAWRWQKEESSKRDAEIQMEVVGSSSDGKKTRLWPLRREVCHFSGRKVRVPLWRLPSSVWSHRHGSSFRETGEWIKVWEEWRWLEATQRRDTARLIDTSSEASDHSLLVFLFELIFIRV